MKHFYCGRLTEVILEDLRGNICGLDVNTSEKVIEIIAVDTEDFTQDLVAELNTKYENVTKRLITTNEALTLTGWEIEVVPVISLPIIQSVLEG